MVAVIVTTSLTLGIGVGATAADQPGGSAAPSEPRSEVASADDSDDVVILWAAAASRTDRRVALEQHAGDLAVPVEEHGVATGDVEVVPARSGRAAAVAAAITRDPAVRVAEPDREVATLTAPDLAALTAPDDPLFVHQWGLHNTGQAFGEGSSVEVGIAGIDVRVLPAWTITRGLPEVEVAVIDTVVDGDHLDLSGAVVAQQLTPHLAGDDQPGEHGTAVTSVIAARADDGFGMAGVAPEASIRDIPAFASGGLEPGGASLSSLVSALELAAASDARIVNASWVVREPSPLLREVIADSGLAVVAAAGNEGRTLTTTSTVFPAAYDLPNVLAVTAIAADGSLPPYANIGREVIDVAAPGDAIPVALPEDQHGLAQGTSFAAPHVSGALALALSVAPYLDVPELVDAVTWTSRFDPSLVEATRSGGMLDAHALVRGVQRPVCRPDRLELAVFPDVDPDSVHAPGIACLREEGIATGHLDGSYLPAQPVSRAQLASLLGRVLLDAGWEPTTAPPAYPDVDPTSVHAPAIAMLDGLDIVRGGADGLFRPEDPVTRGQMASLLVRTYGVLTEDTREPTRTWFDDTLGNVHAAAADVGRDLGILRGVGARDYAPTAITRRDQVATFVARLIDAAAREVAVGTTTGGASEQ